MIFFFYQLFVLSLSQKNLFTFVGGSIEIYEPSFYETLYEYSPQNTPGGVHSYGSIELNSEEILISNGYSSDFYENSMWVLNRTNLQWKCVRYRNYRPDYSLPLQYHAGSNYGARYGNGLYKISETEALVFGGRGYSSSGGQNTLNDIFGLRFSNWDTMFIRGTQNAGDSGAMLVGIKNVYNISYEILQRADFGSWMINGGKEILVYGGRNWDYKVLNDLWKYDIVSNMWSWHNGNPYGINENAVIVVKGEYHPGNKIGCGQFFLYWKDNEEILVVYGGNSCGESNLGSSGLMWKYNLTCSCWMYVRGEMSGKVNTTSNIPGSLTRSAVVKSPCKEYVYIIGGYSDTFEGVGRVNAAWRYHINSDTFRYLGTGNIYTTVLPNYGIKGIFSDENILPIRRSFHAWTSKNSDGKDVLLLYGGNGRSEAGSGTLGDLWTMEINPTCGSFREHDDGVCLKRGKCVDFDKCSCNKNQIYSGSNCEQMKCFGKNHNHPDVCNAVGICIDYNHCACFSYSPYSNPDCSENETLKYLWVIITFPVIFILLILVVVVLIVIFIYVFARLNLKLKKYNEIEDIDIILEEQKLSKNSERARLRVNKKLFEINSHELDIGRKLGSGGGKATVFLTRWKNQDVAYKCFKIDYFASQGKFDNFESELQIMASINFPYIVQFFGASFEKNRLGIVMEYCPHGDMISFVKNYRISNKKEYPLQEKSRMLKEVASSMAYLHDIKVIHRDLKPDNVLISSGFKAKVMDFGLSKIVEDELDEKTRRIGTSCFMAPEVVGSGQYDEKCDVFSFAMLSYIFLTENENPYNSKNSVSYSVEIKVANDENFRPKINKNIPKHFQNIIQQCWRQNPIQRPHFHEIVKSINVSSNELGEITSENKIILLGNEVKSLKKENLDLKRTIRKLRFQIERSKKLVKK